MTLDEALNVLGPIRAVRRKAGPNTRRTWWLYLDGRRGATRDEVIQAAYKENRRLAGIE